MATKKTPDQILDGAADILEKHGWVTSECYDSDTGGYCALGALAKATFPKLANRNVPDRAYVLAAGDVGMYGDNTPVNPNHVEAVRFLAERLTHSTSVEDEDVYSFNDGLSDGIDRDYDFETKKHTVVVDEKVRLRSSRKVVQKLRSAAKAYRKQQEKLAV